PGQHSHFSGEQNLVAAARHGASGSYSALAGISVRYLKEWWAMIDRGDWTAAEARHERVQRFYVQGVQPLRDRGIIAGAIDKAMAQIGGAVGSRLLRPPYPSTPDDMYAKMEAA